jgi:steroid delta-isomerase-like uncharacterized protein
MFEDNKLVCRRLTEEGWNLGKLEVVDELLSPLCRVHDAAFPALAPGPAAYKHHIRMCREAFPDFFCLIDDIIAEDREVVIHWTMRGTQQGRFLELEPTGRQVVVSGTSIHRLENGRIVELWSDWNPQALRAQASVDNGREVARRMIEEVWNNRKPEMVDDYITRDYLRHSPSGELRGAAGFRKDYDTGAFPDCRIRIDEVLGEGDRVVVRWTGMGTHKGKLMGMAPSGQKVTVPGVSVIRLQGGRIAEEHAVWDVLGMLRQIGAGVAAPAAVKARGA